MYSAYLLSSGRLLIVCSLIIASPVLAVFPFGGQQEGPKDSCAKSGWGFFGRAVRDPGEKVPPLLPSEIHYEEYGKGNPETMVLIHGLDSSTKTFDTIIPELAKHYHVVVYDQRGHGKSAERGTIYNSTVMAKDLKQLLDHLGISKCHLLGHSMGGRTAVKFAELYPDRVESVIVEDMEMKARRKPLTDEDRKFLEQDSETLRKMFEGKTYPNREALFKELAKVFGEREARSIVVKRVIELPDGSIKLGFRPWVSILYGTQANAENLDDSLREVSAPTLLVRSDPSEGTAVSSGGARSWGYAKPGMPVRMIPGAGHSVHRDKPVEFLKTVSKFLGQVKDGTVGQVPFVPRDARTQARIHKALYAGKAHPKIASDGVVYTFEGAEGAALPRGSALITSSGELEKQGITAIIHAASGSMVRDDPDFMPSESGVALSVKNSLTLAKRNGIKRVAMPFIGGKIFLDRIGIEPEQLATTIVKAALENRGKVEVVFVMREDVDKELFDRVVAKLAPPRLLSRGAVQVVQGSITDFNAHHAPAIINAANTEVTFGGGVSGAIGSATGRTREIDDEAARAMAKFNGALLPILEQEAEPTGH